MDDNTLATNTSATDAVVEEKSQEQVAQPRTFTQEEFDNHSAALKASLTRKLLKPYEELGDINELRALKEEANKRTQEEQMKKGQFEEILRDLAQKKDAEISKRDSVIREYKIETPLLSAASKYRAVNAEQVRQLLKNNINLNADGEVEVVDDKGQVRYTDRGTAYSVDDLVREWLDANPHFVQAAPATTATKSSITNSQTPVDVSKLDMTNPEHRKVYAQWRKDNGIA